jgi:hypothetical protein
MKYVFNIKALAAYWDGCWQRVGYGGDMDQSNLPR